MKKIFKILGIVLAILLVIVLVTGWVAHEPLPEGKSGPAADTLAQKMLNALNHDRYQVTRYLEWSFQGGRNTYQWDKVKGVCTVQWSDYEVTLNLTDPSQSKVVKSGKLLTGKDSKKGIEKALAFFNNDSFWLVAPYKVFDEGTTRSIVDLEDGTQGLLVSYTRGGTTPGDSYLWLLNDDGFPYAYKMWVKIIPVGGVEATWDDWLVTQSGAFLPKSHQLGPITLDMGEIKGY